jgi:hypothetical protein
LDFPSKFAQSSVFFLSSSRRAPNHCLNVAFKMKNTRPKTVASASPAPVSLDALSLLADQISLIHALYVIILGSILLSLQYWRFITGAVTIGQTLDRPPVFLVRCRCFSLFKFFYPHRRFF